MVDRYKYFDFNGNHINTKHIERYPGQPKKVYWDKAGDPNFENIAPYGWKKRGNGDRLYICEGETDVERFGEALKSAGLGDHTVISAHSTTAAPAMVNSIAEFLTGRSITLLFDNDPTGEQARDRCVERLVELGCSRINCVDWGEDKPKGYDVSDFLTDNSVDQLLSCCRLPNTMTVGADELKPTTGPMWNIQQILPSEGFWVILGEQKSYKTLCALHISFCLATGRFWYQRQTKQCKVLYLAMEGGAFFGDRAIAWREKYSSTSNLRIHTQPDAICFNHKKDCFELSARVKLELLLNPPDVIVIDTLSRMLSGLDENSNAVMSEAAKFLDEICLQHRCNVLLISHTPKGGNETVRGGGALQNAATVVLSVKKENKSGTISVKESRYTDPEGKIESFDIETMLVGEHLQPVIVEKSFNQVLNERVAMIKEAIETVAPTDKNKHVKSEEIQVYCSEKTGKSKSTIRNWIKQAVAESAILAVEGKEGYYKLSA